MNVICLAIDRLHAGYLGPYGNTWIETPAIDRLAAESMVFDQVMIDTPTLDRLYRSYWQGWHAMCLPPPNDRPSLPELLRDAGVGTALMTDERLLAEHPLAVQFDDLVVIDPPWQPEVAPEGEYRADPPGPLLRGDRRLAGRRGAAVSLMVPPGQPGRDVGRAAGVPAPLSG